MAKKKVQPTTEEVEVIEPDTVETTEATEEVNDTKKQKTSKKDKASKNSDVKPKEDSKKDNSKKKDSKNNKNKGKNKNKAEKKSLKKKASEIISELKKVSKPTFGTVVKNTCVVIVVVAICTLLLFGMDKLFSLLYELLLP